MIKFHLKEILDKKRMSINSLSAMTDINRASLSGIVNNSTKMVGLNTLNELCKFFRIPLSDLVEYVPQKTQIKMYVVRTANSFGHIQIIQKDLSKRIDFSVTFSDNDSNIQTVTWNPINPEDDFFKKTLPEISDSMDNLYETATLSIIIDNIFFGTEKMFDSTRLMPDKIVFIDNVFNKFSGIHKKITKLNGFNVITSPQIGNGQKDVALQDEGTSYNNVDFTIHARKRKQLLHAFPAE